jgi:hypothetical protein
MPFRWMYSRKTLRFSLSDYVHSPRAQALPSNLMFLIARGSDHSSKLSLSNSCSNELNQTSDAAEDHDHGHELFATELPNLFIFFCPTLLALFEHCLLPTQADSSAHKKRPNFHSSSLASLTSTHYPFLTSSPFFYRLNLSYIRHQKSSPASVLLTTHMFSYRPELSLRPYLLIAQIPLCQNTQDLTFLAKEQQIDWSILLLNPNRLKNLPGVRKLPTEASRPLCPNQPRSCSPLPPMLPKFGSITINHHPPPFLQVPRTHPSKRRNNNCTPCSSDERRKILAS